MEIENEESKSGESVIWSFKSPSIRGKSKREVEEFRKWQSAKSERADDEERKKAYVGYFGLWALNDVEMIWWDTPWAWPTFFFLFFYKNNNHN